MKKMLFMSLQSDVSKKKLDIKWVFPKIMVPPNHSILIGFSIVDHPFWGTTIFGNIQIVCSNKKHSSKTPWLHILHKLSVGQACKHIGMDLEHEI